MQVADRSHFNAIEDEIRRLRGLVHVRADFHLSLWGEWRRSSGGIARGYPSRSAGIGSGGISGEDAFDHLCEDADRWTAEVADTVIVGMEQKHRTALSHVYEASVWRSNRGDFAELFAEAAGLFWREASRKGLV